VAGLASGAQKSATAVSLSAERNGKHPWAPQNAVIAENGELGQDADAEAGRDSAGWLAGKIWGLCRRYARRDPLSKKRVIRPVAVRHPCRIREAAGNRGGKHDWGTAGRAEQCKTLGPGGVPPVSSYRDQ